MQTGRAAWAACEQLGIGSVGSLPPGQDCPEKKKKNQEIASIAQSYVLFFSASLNGPASREGKTPVARRRPAIRDNLGLPGPTLCWLGCDPKEHGSAYGLGKFSKMQGLYFNAICELKKNHR